MLIKGQKMSKTDLDMEMSKFVGERRKKGAFFKDIDKKFRKKFGQGIPAWIKNLHEFENEEEKKKEKKYHTIIGQKRVGKENDSFEMAKQIFQQFNSPHEAWKWALKHKKEPKLYFDLYLLGEKASKTEKWEDNRMKRRLSKDEIKEIIKLHEEGKSAKELAEMFRVTIPTIMSKLRKADFYKEVSKVEAIKKLLLQGYSIKNLRTMGYEKILIFNARDKLKKEGLLKSGKEIEGIILKLHNEGKKPYEIEEITGFAKEKIKRILKKNGVKDVSFRRKTKIEEVMELLKQGKTTTQILRMGYNNNTLYEARKKLGIAGNRKNKKGEK